MVASQLVSQMQHDIKIVVREIVPEQVALVDILAVARILE